MLVNRSRIIIVAAAAVTFERCRNALASSLSVPFTVDDDEPVKLLATTPLVVEAVSAVPAVEREELVVVAGTVMEEIRW